MKRTPLKPSRRKRPPVDREAAERWVAEVRGLPCAVCGDYCGVTRGHHVLYQQHLRSTCQTLGLDFETYRWDTRNRLPVGDRCHEAHHNASRRISRSVLVFYCTGVFEMAEELGLLGRLERAYPAYERAVA